MSVRLLVVDDHALFRQGLIGLLNDLPGIQVIGEAADGRQAVEVARRTRPDVVLLDVNMPGTDGVTAVRALKQLRPAPKVLMLTISQHERDLLGAIRAGADGYLLKNAEPEELHTAIRRVAAGQSVLSPEVTRQVMDSLRRPARGLEEPLSEREMDVLRCMAQGCTTAEIAERLYISRNTVKTHIRHILEKLGADNRVEAVSKAIQRGLLRPGEP